MSTQGTAWWLVASLDAGGAIRIDAYPHEKYGLNAARKSNSLMPDGKPVRVELTTLVRPAGATLTDETQL